MQINTELAMVQSSTSGNIQIGYKSEAIVVDKSNASYPALNTIYGKLRAVSASERSALFQKMADDGKIAPLFSALGFSGFTAEDGTVINNVLSAEDVLSRGLTGLLKFFKDVQFTPSFRFVNTLSTQLTQSGEKEGREYIKNYFALMNSSYLTEVAEKMKSAEFKSILADISAVKPTHTVNSRLKIYFGTQGTGKTTIAMQESGNKCIVCNSSMLPADLMEDFVFVDGKATFKPSSLWRCMEDGTKIVLDEINLLPFDSLRFLQGIADGKTEFEYKGQTVHIKDGFQIIGTMNLTVNGMTYGLPEPLVDRSAELKEFTLTAEMLKGAIL